MDGSTCGMTVFINLQAWNLTLGTLSLLNLSISGRRTVVRMSELTTVAMAATASRMVIRKR